MWELGDREWDIYIAYLSLSRSTPLKFSNTFSHSILCLHLKLSQQCVWSYNDMLIAEWGISLFYSASTITYSFISEARPWFYIKHSALCLSLSNAVMAKHLDRSSNSGNGTPNFFYKKLINTSLVCRFSSDCMRRSGRGKPDTLKVHHWGANN